MSSQMVASNVVIAARQFNPSVMSQLWLVKHKLMDEGDFESGCVFSDSLVQVMAKDFVLLVVPEQFQFVPRTEAGDELRLIENKVGVIVNRLPHTPFTAVGLNFVWLVVPENGDIQNLSRQMFFRKNSDLYKYFDSEDSKFGAYLSRDILGCRLKLDIKPIQTPDTKEDRLQFVFNYHLDLAGCDSPVSAIETMLHKWEEAKAYASKLIQTALPRG
jgi:hypothetical protein